MEYVNCPVCREKAVPKGGTHCEFCGWEKGKKKDKQTEPVEQPAREEIKQTPPAADVVEEQQAPQTEEKPQRKVRTCEVDNCDRKHQARGYCSSHYAEWQKYGRILTDEERQANKAKRGNNGKQNLRNAGNAEQQPKSEPVADSPAPSTSTKKTDNSIGKCELRFFKRDEDMFNLLTKAAAYNRRTIQAEILFRLERSSEDTFGGMA